MSKTIPLEETVSSHSFQSPVDLPVAPVRNIKDDSEDLLSTTMGRDGGEHPKVNLSEKKRIVIIEDETMLRDLVVEVLKGYPNCELVGTFGDGIEGRDQCAKLKPDIVFLDVKLPSLNGLEILRYLKTKLPRTKVFLFSSYFSPEEIRQALKVGSDVVLEKTSRLDEFHKAIRKILVGDPYMGPGVVKALRQIMLDPNQDRSLDSLTTREREVLQMIAEGYSSKEIAEFLEIKPKTAEAHRSNLMKKLSVRRIAGLTRYAIAHGMIRKEINYVS